MTARAHRHRAARSHRAGDRHHLRRGMRDDRSTRIATSQTTFSTPGGKCRDAISASITVVTGVVSRGLMTTVLPAAMAGQNFQIAIIIG